MDDIDLHPEDMLCFEVYALQQAFGRIYAPLLEPLGLTYPQYMVLVVLWSRGATQVGAIGAELGLGTGTLTPVVKRLETGGLVTRRRPAEDERRVLVSLTEAGEAMRARAADVPRCVERATGLDAAEIARTRTGLAALRRALLRSARR